MSWVAVGVIGGTVIGGVVTQSMQDKANKSAQRRGMTQQRAWNLEDYERLMADWKKYAFPNKKAMQAETAGGLNMLGQAFKGMGDKVFSQSASRGFGPGSGLTMKSLGDVEGSYMNAMSQMMTNLAKFQNTPQWGSPQGIGQVTPTPVPADQMWGNLGNDIGTLGGYAMAGGFGDFRQQPTQPWDYSTPYGAQFGVANPKYGW